MNQKQLKQKIRQLNRAGIRIGMGVMLFLLAPMVYVALCTTRRMEMSKINVYGTGWALICVILGLIGLARGISMYLMERELFQFPLVLKKKAYAYMESYQKKRLAKLFSHIASGVIVCLLSSFFIVTICSISKTDYKLIEISFYCTFLLIGFGVLLIISACMNYKMSGKLKYAKVEQESEQEEKQTFGEIIQAALLVHKKLFAVAMVVVIGTCIFLTMSNGTWYVQPYVSTIPVVDLPKHPVTYEKDTGIYSIEKQQGKDFKILQLTDIHLGGSAFSYSKDLKALQAVYELILDTKPDLVIVTGDFVFPLGIESFSFNNYTPILQFSSFMRNMGVCWAFTYGNHDTEFVASHSEKELNDLFHKFSYETTRSLLYSEKQPKISGRSNQVIVIKNPNGSINQALYLIDSNSYSGKKINDYDYIHDDQVEWYEQSVRDLSEYQGKTISSMIFAHIPLQEYKTAYDLYKQGSDEVTYYFGEIGEKGEAICCSDHKSLLFERAVELQSTKAIFSGHDHYNNICLGYQGIKLTYGMSIDYLAMPGIAKKTKQRGGTLISLHDDSTFDIQQVPLTSVQNEKQ